MTNDIPILEGEEMWAQEAIDRSQEGFYRVSYYTTGQYVAFKTFKTFKEATDFSVYKVNSGDVIEIKKVENAS